MAVDIWPASLPQNFLLAGYSEGLGDGRLRSNMDTGPAKVRRRSSSIPAPISAQMVMTAAQVQTLAAFVKGPLAGGAFPFTIGGRLVRISGAMPSWTPITPSLFTVSLSLEVLP